MNYSYSISQDIVSGVLNASLLADEIRASSITVSLDRIDTEGDDLTVIFRAAISVGEKTTLDGLIVNHSGAPSENPTTVLIAQADPNTEGIQVSPKWSPNGWFQVYHEIEFETSKLNSVHDKDWLNQNNGFTTLAFRDAGGNVLTTQETIDSSCVETWCDFMPTFDYSIKSGQVAQIVSPASAVYLWAVGAPDIQPTQFCNGGINLEFIDVKTLVGLDGTGPTMMPYYGGVGANKIRFVVRHPAGFKHRIQAIFEYYKA